MADLFVDFNATNKQEQLESEKRYRVEQIKHYNKDLNKETKKIVISSILGSVVAMGLIAAPGFIVANNVLNWIGVAGFNAAAIFGYVMLVINSIKNKTNIKINVEDIKERLLEIENELGELNNNKENKGINI